MNRLEEITDKVKEYKYLRDKGKVLDQPRFSKLLNSFPADIEYLLQRLERYEKALNDVSEHCYSCGGEFVSPEKDCIKIVKEALKGDE